VYAKPLHVYLVAVGDNSTESALKLAYDLRARTPALRLINNLSGGSFKAQFKRADKSGALLALVLGEQEIQNGEVTVKFLRSDQPQLTMSNEQLVDWIHHKLDVGR